MLTHEFRSTESQQFLNLRTKIIQRRDTYERSIMAKARRKIRWRAVRVNERILFKLYKLFNPNNNGMLPLFTVSLSNNTKREALTVDELLSFSNSSARDFTRIELSDSWQKTPTQRVSIDQRGPNVEYYISSDDHMEVDCLRREVEKLLKHCYQPGGYSMLSIILGRRLSNYIAPPVLFEVGNGIDRSKRLQERRTLLLTVIIPSIVIGLLVSYLYDKIK